MDIHVNESVQEAVARLHADVRSGHVTVDDLKREARRYNALHTHAQQHIPRGAILGFRQKYPWRHTGAGWKMPPPIFAHHDPARYPPTELPTKRKLKRRPHRPRRYHFAARATPRPAQVYETNLDYISVVDPSTRREYELVVARRSLQRGEPFLYLEGEKRKRIKFLGDEKDTDDDAREDKRRKRDGDGTNQRPILISSEEASEGVKRGVLIPITTGPPDAMDVDQVVSSADEADEFSISIDRDLALVDELSDDDESGEEESEVWVNPDGDDEDEDDMTPEQIEVAVLMRYDPTDPELELKADRFRPLFTIGYAVGSMRTSGFSFDKYVETAIIANQQRTAKAVEKTSVVFIKDDPMVNLDGAYNGLLYHPPKLHAGVVIRNDWVAQYMPLLTGPVVERNRNTFQRPEPLSLYQERIATMNSELGDELEYRSSANVRKRSSEVQQFVADNVMSVVRDQVNALELSASIKAEQSILPANLSDVAGLLQMQKEQKRAALVGEKNVFEPTEDTSKRLIALSLALRVELRDVAVNAVTQTPFLKQLCATYMFLRPPVLELDLTLDEQFSSFVEVRPADSLVTTFFETIGEQTFEYGDFMYPFWLLEQTLREVNARATKVLGGMQNELAKSTLMMRHAAMQKVIEHVLHLTFTTNLSLVVDSAEGVEGGKAGVFLTIEPNTLDEARLSLTEQNPEYPFARLGSLDPNFRSTISLATDVAIALLKENKGIRTLACDASFFAGGDLEALGGQIVKSLARKVIKSTRYVTLYVGEGVMIGTTVTFPVTRKIRKFAVTPRPFVLGDVTSDIYAAALRASEKTQRDVTARAIEKDADLQGLLAEDETRDKSTSGGDDDAMLIDYVQNRNAAAEATASESFEGYDLRWVSTLLQQIATTGGKLESLSVMPRTDRDDTLNPTTTAVVLSDDFWKSQQKSLKRIWVPSEYMDRPAALRGDGDRLPPTLFDLAPGFSSTAAHFDMQRLLKAKVKDANVFSNLTTLIMPHTYMRSVKPNAKSLAKLLKTYGPSTIAFLSDSNPNKNAALEHLHFCKTLGKSSVASKLRVLIIHYGFPLFADPMKWTSLEYYAPPMTVPPLPMSRARAVHARLYHFMAGTVPGGSPTDRLSKLPNLRVVGDYSRFVQKLAPGDKHTRVRFLDNAKFPKLRAVIAPTENVVDARIFSAFARGLPHAKNEMVIPITPQFAPEFDADKYASANNYRAALRSTGPGGATPLPEAPWSELHCVQFCVVDEAKFTALVESADLGAKAWVGRAKSPGARPDFVPLSANQQARLYNAGIRAWHWRKYLEKILYLKPHEWTLAESQYPLQWVHNTDLHPWRFLYEAAGTKARERYPSYPLLHANLPETADASPTDQLDITNDGLDVGDDDEVIPDITSEMSDAEKQKIVKRARGALTTSMGIIGGVTRDEVLARAAKAMRIESATSDMTDQEFITFTRDVVDRFAGPLEPLDAQSRTRLVYDALNDVRGSALREGTNRMASRPFKVVASDNVAQRAARVYRAVRILYDLVRGPSPLPPAPSWEGIALGAVPTGRINELSEDVWQSVDDVVKLVESRVSGSVVVGPTKLPESTIPASVYYKHRIAFALERIATKLKAYLISNSSAVSTPPSPQPERMEIDPPASAPAIKTSGWPEALERVRNILDDKSAMGAAGPDIRRMKAIAVLLAGKGNAQLPDSLLKYPAWIIANAPAILPGLSLPATATSSSMLTLGPILSTALQTYTPPLQLPLDAFYRKIAQVLGPIFNGVRPKNNADVMTAMAYLAPALQSLVGPLPDTKSERTQAVFQMLVLLGLLDETKDAVIANSFADIVRAVVGPAFTSAGLLGLDQM